MLPVSRSSPENSRLLGLLFSNNLNLHIKISNFLAKSNDFEYFLKNSILENFYKYFDPLCIGKVDYKISNFLEKSDDFKHFLKNSIFEKFYKYFVPLCIGKVDFEIFNFLDKSDDLEHFLKNSKCFEPFCTAKID